MRIAIIGGTGTLGRLVAEELQLRGHDVRVLSRHAEKFRVDLTTGDGLAAALEGCEVVVDASNSKNAKRARTILVEGTRRLLAAEQAAGVRHHVCISIVGCDGVPFAYYKVKVDQEMEVTASPVPWTIIRASQFHEFVTDAFELTAKYGVLPILSAPLQTVSAADVARIVAERAMSEPLCGRFEIAGPEVLTMKELSQQWKRGTGRRALGLKVPVPGAAGRALRSGAMTAKSPDVLGRQTFADWLAETHRPARGLGRGAEL